MHNIHRQNSVTFGFQSSVRQRGSFLAFRAFGLREENRRLSNSITPSFAMSDQKYGLFGSLC